MSERSWFNRLMDRLDRFESWVLIGGGMILGAVFWQIVYSTVYYLQTGRWI